MFFNDCTPISDSKQIVIIFNFKSKWYSWLGSKMLMIEMAIPLFTKRKIKNELRQTYKRKRQEFSKSLQKSKFDKKIIKAIEELPEFKRAKTIFFFASHKDEIDTHQLINKYIKTKNIILPKTNTKDHTMKLYLIESLDDIKEGNFGILEPIIKKCKEIKTREIDLALIPGIVFDRTGHRIGFGKGYYDKLLKKHETIKVGLCYEFQLVDTIPALSHDVKVNKTTTEQKTYSYS